MASVKPKDKRLTIITRSIQLTTDSAGLLGIGPDGTRYRRFCNYGSEHEFDKVEDVELLTFIDLPGAGLWLEEGDHRYLTRLMRKLKNK